MAFRHRTYIEAYFTPVLVGSTLFDLDSTSGTVGWSAARVGDAETSKAIESTCGLVFLLI